MSSTLQICPFAAAPPTSRTAVWEVTSACNMHCSHCLAQAGERSDIPLDHASIVLALHALNVTEVVISGGEPLLYPHTGTLIRSLGEMGMTAMLYTNGLLVTPAVAQELRQAGLSYAFVSLDGVTPETHEYLRSGQPSFETACEACRILRAHGIDVCLAMSVGRHNAHEVGQMVQLADSLGAVELTITPVMPLGRGVDRYKELMLDLTTRRRLAIDICSMVENYPAVNVERIRLPLPGEEQEVETQCRYASLVMLSADGVIGTCPWMAIVGLGTVSMNCHQIGASYMKAYEKTTAMLQGRAADAGCPLAATLYGHGILDRDPLLCSKTASADI